MAPSSVVAAPEGQLTWAFHVSLAPGWLTLIPGHPYSAPYEDLKLKSK